MTTTVAVTDMSCDGCEDIVEGAVEEVSGVESATADRSSETVTIEGEPEEEAVLEAIDFAGYSASVVDETEESDATEGESEGGEEREIETDDGAGTGPEGESGPEDGSGPQDGTGANDVTNGEGESSDETETGDGDETDDAGDESGEADAEEDDEGDADGSEGTDREDDS